MTEISKEQMTNYLMRGMAARAMINKREFTDEEAATHNAILNLIESSPSGDKPSGEQAKPEKPAPPTDEEEARIDEQLRAGNKCDRCPFGSMLKEYEDDESPGFDQHNPAKEEYRGFHDVAEFYPTAEEEAQKAAEEERREIVKELHEAHAEAIIDGDGKREEMLERAINLIRVVEPSEAAEGEPEGGGE